MTTQPKKLLVVFGATGAQGGPVARYVLKNSSQLYDVRAVTRNASSAAALKLKELGAEVFTADFDDEPSIRGALSGAHAVFGITNFWDKADYDLEVRQGKLLNRIADESTTLEHFVYSGLLSMERIGASYENILPYNSKEAIRADIENNHPSLWAKTTEVLLSFYFQNWVKYPIVFGPVKQADGSFVMPMPYPGSSLIPVANADDAGAFIDALLKGGSKYYGKSASFVGEVLPEVERIKIWADIVGVKAVFKEDTFEAHKARMLAAGLPEHLALAVTELVAVLPEEKGPMEAKTYVNGKSIISPEYKIKSWAEYCKEEDWSSLLA